MKQNILSIFYWIPDPINGQTMYSKDLIFKWLNSSDFECRPKSVPTIDQFSDAFDTICNWTFSI